MDEVATPTARVERFQFSLRGLFLLMTIVCVVLSPAYVLGSTYMIPALISLAMVAACVWAYRRRRPWSVIAYASLGVLIGVFLSVMVLFLHGLIALFASMFCLAAKARPRTLAIVLTIAAVLPYGVMFAANVSIARRVNAMRRRYPLVSIGARLEFERGPDRSNAERTSGDRNQSFAPDVLKRLDGMENRLEFEGYKRVWTLHLLHDETYRRFVQSDGFGVGRMRPVNPDDAVLEPRLAVRLPILVEIGDRPLTPETLVDVHLIAQQDFLSPARIGYVRSRDEVAGFESHGFSILEEWLLRFAGYTGRNTATEETYNGPPTKWQLDRLELVSLLRHEEPRVYIAETLPQMDQLDEVPNRPLNDFEKSALPNIRYAQDIVADINVVRIKMLGAVRAGSDCLQCHEGSRGQLLGAFSYELTPHVDESDY